MLQFMVRISCLLLFWMGIAQASQIQLLPAGPIVADGKEQATLHIWAPQLKETDKVKIKPAQGKLGEVIRKPGGILEVTWVPGLETAQRSVDIAVSIRKRGSDPENANLTVTLHPPDSGKIAINATPGEWAPGQEAIQLKFSLEGTARQGVADRRLLISSSIGSITEAVPLGDGTFSARWTPPTETLTARTVVISAVDAAVPSKVYGWMAFPLLAKQNLSFGATPDSQNVLIVEDREYGPVKASPAGTVAFDALVHPQVRKGTLRSTLRDGRTLDVPAPLPLTEYPRVSFLPQPTSMPAGAKHEILLVATTPAGDPLDTATITIRANASTLGTATKTSTPGVYALSVTPDQAGQIPMEAKMKDPSVLIGKVQAASSTLNVIAPSHRAQISVEPNTFKEGASQILFTANVVTHTGAPVTNAAPDFGTTGGAAVGRPASSRDGRYTMKLRPQADSVFAAAVPKLATSSLSPAHLIVWPAAEAVDPGESIPILVAAVDAFGHPVANVNVELTSASGGTLSAPASNGGIAIATYTASSNPGLFTISASAAGLTAEAAIFHGDESAGPGSLTSGSSVTIKLRDELSKLVGAVRVEQEEPPPPVAVVAPVVAPAVVPAAVPVAVPAVVAAATVPEVPETPEIPAVPGMSKLGAKKKPKAPAKEKGSLLGGSTSEFYFAMVGSPHMFAQTADLPEVDEPSPLPPTAEFSRGLAPGIRFGGDYWLKDGPLAITFDTRITFESVKAGGRVMSFNSWSTQVGAKYKIAELGFGTPYVIGTLQRSQTTLFKFRDATGTTMSPTQQSLIGTRIGGGVLVPVGASLTVDTHISELFALLPVHTNVGALAYYEVMPDLKLMTGSELYFKHVSLKSGGIDVKIGETEISFLAGVRYSGL